MRRGRGPTPQAEVKLINWFAAGGQPATAVTHDADGYVQADTGAFGALSGTSTHVAVHTSSGALVGQGSTVSGSSTRTAASPGVTHDADGYIQADSGAFGSLSGTSTRTAGGGVTHTSSGALVGQGSTVSGTSDKTHPHTSSGALVGQGSTVSGTSTRTGITHTSSGALVGQGSTVSGTSTRAHPHTSSGALVGQGSTVSGTSTRTGAPVTHTSSGALVGPGSLVAGSGRVSALVTSSTIAPIIGSPGKVRSARKDPSSALSALLAPPRSVQIAQQLEQAAQEAAAQAEPPAPAEVVKAVLAAIEPINNAGFVEEYVRAYMDLYEQQRQAQLVHQEQQRLADEEAQALMAFMLML